MATSFGIGPRDAGADKNMRSKGQGPTREQREHEAALGQADRPQDRGEAEAVHQAEAEGEQDPGRIRQ